MSAHFGLWKAWRTALIAALAWTAAGSACAESRAVIFIPGIFGTMLRDVHTQERVFVSVSGLLNGGALSLYRDELATPAGADVEADAVFESVNVGLFHIDVYRTILDALRRLPDTRVVTLPYDWRRNPYEAVLALDQKVRELQGEGLTQIDVVGHSLGGLIASYYLAYGVQPPATARLDWSGVASLHRMVMLGTPYGGAFTFFGSVNQGADLPMMGRLFPAETMASYPSSYVALPFDSAHVLDRELHAEPIPLGDAAFWERTRAGLLARSDLPAAVLANRRAFTEQQLGEAQRFQALARIAQDPQVTPPASLSILAVIGVGNATVDAAYFLPTADGVGRFVFANALRDGLRAEPLQTDGDGIVTTAASAIPLALQSAATVIRTNADHNGMVKDASIVGSITEFLTRD